MDLPTAVRLSSLCHEVYGNLDGCSVGAFPFHVLSDESTVTLVFRGTRAASPGVKGAVDLATQWITSLDMAQTSVEGRYRVHRGFWKEITTIAHKLAAVLREHGVASKRFFVTGHSAGAALATLAARALHEASVATAEAVYVYASPRVGDRTFAESYPVPLYRFETADDLIPRFPPPHMEYVHAGRRFVIVEREVEHNRLFIGRHTAAHYRDCLCRLAVRLKIAA